MVPEALARTKESLPRDLQVQSQGEAVSPRLAGLTQSRRRHDANQENPVLVALPEP